MKSFFHYFSLFFVPFIIFSSCSKPKVTIDPLPKLTRLNAENYAVSGTCSSESQVTIQYKYKVKKAEREEYVDFVHCKKKRWSATIDFSKINRNKVKEITLHVDAVNKFSPGEGLAWSKIQVVSDSVKTFIDDSVLMKIRNFEAVPEELAISGGCARDGDALTLSTGETVIDEVICEEGLWQTILNLNDIPWEEGKPVEVTVRHEDENGVVTEDSTSFPVGDENSGTNL